MPSIYRVYVENNVVARVEVAPAPVRWSGPATKLDVTSQLAENNRRNGRLDGVYEFDDAERAKNFCILCLDFMLKLIERAIADAENMDLGTERGWRNPFVTSARHNKK